MRQALASSRGRFRCRNFLGGSAHWDMEPRQLPVPMSEPALEKFVKRLQPPDFGDLRGSDLRPALGGRLGSSDVGTLRFTLAPLTPFLGRRPLGEGAWDASRRTVADVNVFRPWGRLFRVVGLFAPRDSLGAPFGFPHPIRRHRARDLRGRSQPDPAGVGPVAPPRRPAVIPARTIAWPPAEHWTWRAGDRTGEKVERVPTSELLPPGWSTALVGLVSGLGPICSGESDPPISER